MLGTMMRYPLTLPTILEHAGRVHHDTEIVSRLADKSLHRYTYRDLYRRARALAEALQRAGLRPGERVGTLMWNHYAHLEAYFGVPCAGGVVHTLNLRLNPPDIAYIARHAGDRFLIVDDVLLPLLEKFRDQVPFERIFVVRLSDAPVPEGYEDYDALLATASGDFTYPEIDEEQACGMCYTSGTTGHPKGVAYSHRALILHSFCIALPDATGLSMRETVLPVVPMFHANAWGLPFACAMTGSKQVFPGPFLDAESLLDLFERERVTMTAGVPTIWMGILDALKANPERWKLVSGMRMVVGGSACPESLFREFDDFGLRVVHAWGMTELTPIGTVGILKSELETRDADTRYALRAKQGLPVPFVEARAVGEHGEVAWDGQSMGELQVRGPWVAASYFAPDEPTHGWTEDGWFRTGDVVSIDSDGYVKITDRTKDLIKSGGEWISSVELENALIGHPAVKEAAVIAVAHPKWQERPLAAVVLQDGAEATAEDLRAHLADRFAPWWLPDAIEFIDEIPKTSTGKFQKSRLRERYQDYRLPG